MVGGDLKYSPSHDRNRRSKVKVHRSDSNFHMVNFEARFYRKNVVAIGLVLGGMVGVTKTFASQVMGIEGQRSKVRGQILFSHGQYCSTFLKKP